MVKKTIIAIALLLALVVAGEANATTYTIDYGNTINTIPDDYFYAHDLTHSTSNTSSFDFNNDGSATHSEPGNFTWAQFIVQDLLLDGLRVDEDKANLCDTDENCANNRSGVSPHTVIVGVNSEVTFLASVGMRLLGINDDNPTWNANSSYKCASQSRECGVADFVLEQTTIENYFIKSACAVLGICDREVWNENYNSIYWQPDVVRGSTTCDNITRDFNTYALQSFAQWRAGPYFNSTNEILYAALYPDVSGGSYSFTINSCSAYISDTELGNFTNATGTQASAHPYAFQHGTQTLADWREHFEETVTWATTRGYYEVALSEFADYRSGPCGQGADNWNYTYCYNTYAYMYSVAADMPQIKKLVLFPLLFDGTQTNSSSTPNYNVYFCRENNLAFGSHLNGSCTPVYNATKAQTLYFGTNSEIKSDNEDQSVFILADMKTNGSAFVQVGSKNASSSKAVVLNIANFSSEVSGGTAYSLINKANGTVHVLTSNATTNLADMLPGEVRIYEINYSVSGGGVGNCTQYYGLPAVVSSTGVARYSSNSSCESNHTVSGIPSVLCPVGANCY